MQVDSVQTVNHYTPNQRVIERVFYGTDERTGAQLQHSLYYVVEVYNKQGQVEQSGRGSSVDVRA